jgi:hypothetical protein
MNATFRGLLASAYTCFGASRIPVPIHLSAYVDTIPRGASFISSLNVNNSPLHTLVFGSANLSHGAISLDYEEDNLSNSDSVGVNLFTERLAARRGSCRGEKHFSTKHLLLNHSVRRCFPSLHIFRKSSHDHISNWSYL